MITIFKQWFIILYLCTNSLVLSVINIKDADYTKSVGVSKEVLSLPIHPFLDQYEVEYIVQKVNCFTSE